jgi:hypothetical protein
MTGTVWSVGTGWTGYGAGTISPDLYGSLWYVEKSTGWYGSPAMRAQVTDREQSDGVFDGPAWLPGRQVVLEGVVTGQSRAGLLQSLRAARGLLVAGNRVDTLTCADDDVALQAVVRRDGESLFEQTGLSAQFSMSFFAPDPVLYSTALHTATTGLYSGGAGRPYPLVFPLVYGAMGSTGVLPIVNAGNLNSYPVVTLSNPITSPPLVNPSVQLSGGSRVALNLTLAPGDAVTIDTGQQTVLLNGTASRYSALTVDSAFFGCQPGSSQLLFTADSGSGATLTATWRDPYA